MICVNINVCYWNVAKNLIRISKTNKCSSPIYINDFSMFFVSETNLNYKCLPEFQNYKLIADPTKNECTHGGIAWYLKNNLFPHMFDVCLKDTYISFRLHLCPIYRFIGTYIQPEGGKYADSSQFAELDLLTSNDRELGIIPLLGGDLNCRPGDIGTWHQNWNFSENCDKNKNTYGRLYFKSLCLSTDLIPLNGLMLGNKKFDNEFTFFRGNQHSQIDYILTTSEAFKSLESFRVIKDNWHASDHRPISVQLNINCEIDYHTLLKRSKDLNFTHNSSNSNVKRLNGNYDYQLINDRLISNQINVNRDVFNNLNNNDIENAIYTLENHISDAHKNAKISVNVNHTHTMLEANDKFDLYLEGLKSNIISNENLQRRLDNYISARKNVSQIEMNNELNKWNETLNTNDSKKLWNELIQWKGEITKRQVTIKPNPEDCKLYFEKLYESKIDDEKEKILSLQSNCYIPCLDDPINELEIREAHRQIKKCGYDFKLPVLNVLVFNFIFCLVNLINFIFYVNYPKILANSLMFLIPKKGNLLLPQNYRGIQMIKTIGVLYDRILYNRLRLWLGGIIHDAQTAFQKDKSSLYHIFILRIIIEICKSKKVPLYICYTDLEKAFDITSRFIMLSKLVKLGIGSCMLAALKSLYIFTTCIINIFGDESDIFEVKAGIRQGAASSVLLFLIMMNDIFDYLGNRCRNDLILGNLHALVHADDTIILSTNRSEFVHKCNHMMNYFEINKLRLNLGKSSYMILNPQRNDIKSSIPLNGGILKYKSSNKYLGILISDSGIIKNDVTSFVHDKIGDVLIKYKNFCKSNRNAPLFVKLKVLKTCVTSSLLYACETWSSCLPNIVETSYRSGLKTALSVRDNINNEIIYTECNEYPLTCTIQKSQLSFWLKINTYINENPDSPLNFIINIALSLNISYLKHYVNLQNKYGSPENCFSCLQQYYKNIWKNQFMKFSNDINSRLGYYLLVNPSLSCVIDSYQNLFETDRIYISRFRTGSHSLLIETGRYNNIDRDNRICICRNGLQTVFHVFCECPITIPLLDKRYNNIQEIFSSSNLHVNLLLIAKSLKISL